MIIRSGVLVAALAGLAGAAPLDPNSAAARVAGGALLDGQAYADAQALSDRIGQRLAGSAAAERAVEWALATMRAAGLKNVRREPVKIPRWLRGDERAEIVAPASLPLHAAALGGSVGTPKGGLTAEVIEVATPDELKTIGERARGKIVLFNKPMQRTRGFEGYGAAVGARGRGAVEAAKVGAVAALIRSVGTGPGRLPHTGATRYDDQVAKIPFAALAAEDAELLHRLLASGAVKVRLELGAHVASDVESANVVGEVPGREKPGEIVVIGAHLDSWDLGAGALDDAAGCAIALEVGRLTAAVGGARRTLRVVLFMNEENGLSGARAYAEAHKAELSQHAAALEADGGAGRPTGIAVVAPAATPAPSLPLVTAWAAPLAALQLDAPRVLDQGGSDLRPLQSAGVPIVDVLQDMSSYFDWHHSAGDTFDKIDPHDLALDAVAYAVMAFAAADAPERLPPSPPPPRW
ncbi:MAG TPA: M28 family peptidase [Polyangia bacterium]|nr:M28 family peptidase [Polyangia bacterium]